MRFMLMIKADKNTVLPTPALMGAIGKLGEEMSKAGVLLDTGGMLDTAHVRATGGTVTTLDGPFTETKEMVGGYAMVQVKTREEAIEMARRFMKLHTDLLGPTYSGTSEVLQLLEPGDMPRG